jgi:Ala-tRNA(Pro) deacylase
MTISSKLKNYLDKEKINYQILEHSPAYTAMEIAGSQHVPGRQVVKSVIVNADGKFIMCVLPSIHYLDLDKLKFIIKTKEIHLANEGEISKLFPDYEVGAEPPFGHLYGLAIYADKILEEDENIVFNAGTHTDMIRIKLADYKRLARPIFSDIGVHVHTVKG